VPNIWYAITSHHIAIASVDSWNKNAAKDRNFKLKRNEKYKKQERKKERISKKKGGRPPQKKKNKHCVPQVAFEEILA
jgi:hypothetical protein